MEVLLVIWRELCLSGAAEVPVASAPLEYVEELLSPLPVRAGPASPARASVMRPSYAEADCSILAATVD